MATAQIEILTGILVNGDELAKGVARVFGAGSSPFVAALLDAIDTVVFVADQRGTLRYVNAAWSRLTGYSLQETRTLAQLDYLHPQNLDRWLRFLDARKRNPGGTGAVVLRFLTKSGEKIHLEAQAQAVVANDRCTGFVGTLSDVGSRVRAEEMKEASHRTVETLINNLPGLVYRCRNNRQWTMEYMSRGCVALTGYPPEALINNERLTFGDLIVREDREQVWDNVQIALREHRPFELMYRIRTAQGQEKWVLERGRGNFSTSGELLGLEGFITDVTREKREQLRLRNDSLRDPETRLPTPALFLDRVEMALRRTKFGSLSVVAVLIVHLDQFAKWRETLGADLRDRLLRDIADRMDRALSPVDSLCQWHDNEFAVLHECAGVDEVLDIGANIQRELRVSFIDGDREVFLTVSIGASINATGNEKAEEMISVASTAARRARSTGIGRIEVVDMRSSQNTAVDRQKK